MIRLPIFDLIDVSAMSVPGLGTKALLVEDHRLADGRWLMLIDADLCPDDMDEVIADLLGMAAHALAAEP